MPKDEVEINNDYTMGETSSSSTTNLVANLNANLSVNVNVNLPKNPTPAAIREDRLRFHERVGTLVKLSNNARTAERRRPLDEFNNGVVMTHRPLRDNELFEVSSQIHIKLAISYKIAFTQIPIAIDNECILCYCNFISKLFTLSCKLSLDCYRYE